MGRKKPEVITTYKGFDKNLKCRDFQYEIGETYTHNGEVQACKSGFHACEYPLDVFGYYPPSESRFAVVEQSGELSRHGDDSKVASKTIAIKAELSLPALIKAAIEFTFSRSKPEGETATGYRGAASATGDQGAASATGYRGAASATGEQSVALSSGYRGRAKASAGSAIFLVYRNDDYEIIHAAAGIAGKDVKPDVWYELNSSGEFVEVES